MRRDESPPSSAAQPEAQSSHAPGQPTFSGPAVFSAFQLLPQGTVAISTSTLASSTTTSIFPQGASTMHPLPFYVSGGVPSSAPDHPQPGLPLYHRVQMQISVQPPAKTVYQRILKPFPSVYLILPPVQAQGSGDPLSLLYEALSSKSHEDGVFVEASVVRNDNGEALERSIDGHTTARLEKSGWSSGVYTATFKKLKLLTTSQQCSGTKFSLCFKLKSSTLALGSLSEMVLISNPIEVFSHSQYLGKSEDDARGQQGALKYAENPAGLHIKLMESIHAFKELGGSQETLIQYIRAIYNLHNPIPTSTVALPLSTSPAPPLSHTFVTLAHPPSYQHPATDGRNSTPGPADGFVHSNQGPMGVLPPQPTFSSLSPPQPSSSAGCSPPSSPPGLLQPSTSLGPTSGSSGAAPPRASLLPSIASLLASTSPFPSATPGHHHQHQQHQQQMSHDSFLPSTGLLAPLQALSQACHEQSEETAGSKRKGRPRAFSVALPPDALPRQERGDDEDVTRNARHHKRRKSAD